MNLNLKKIVSALVSVNLLFPNSYAMRSIIRPSTQTTEKILKRREKFRAGYQNYVNKKRYQTSFLLYLLTKKNISVTLEGYSQNSSDPNIFCDIIKSNNNLILNLLEEYKNIKNKMEKL